MAFMQLRNATHFGGLDLTALFSTRSVAAVVGPLGWLPETVFVSDGTAVVNVAPGAAKSYGVQLQINEVDVGSPVTISGAALSARAAMNVTLPLVGSGAQASAFNIDKQLTGAASQQVQSGFKYLTSAPDSDLSWYGSGDDSFNVTMTGTDRFVGFNWFGTFATDTSGQCPWPSAGTFKSLMIRYAANAGTTVDFFMRKNGVDTAMGFSGLTGDGAVHALTDTHTVSVVAGDKLDFRYKRASGAGTSFIYYVTVAFSKVI